MTTRVHCDGCGRTLTSRYYTPDAHTVHGERLPTCIVGPRPLPSGEFDWCNECARIAFEAVHAHANKSHEVVT